MNFTFLTGQIPNETWSFFALRPGLLLASIVGFGCSSVARAG